MQGLMKKIIETESEGKRVKVVPALL